MLSLINYYTDDKGVTWCAVLDSDDKTIEKVNLQTIKSVFENGVHVGGFAYNGELHHTVSLPVKSLGRDRNGQHFAVSDINISVSPLAVEKHFSGLRMWGIPAAKRETYRILPDDTAIGDGTGTLRLHFENALLNKKGDCYMGVSWGRKGSFVTFMPNQSLPFDMPILLPESNMSFLEYILTLTDSQKEYKLLNF